MSHNININEISPPIHPPSKKTLFSRFYDNFLGHKSLLYYIIHHGPLSPHHDHDRKPDNNDNNNNNNNNNYPPPPPPILYKLIPLVNHPPPRITCYIFYILWTLLTVLAIYFNNYAAMTPFGTPPEYIPCSSSTWRWGDGCGLNGMYCSPFNDKFVLFRCPGMCSENRVLTKSWIGHTIVDIGSKFIIGGGGDFSTSSTNASSTNTSNNLSEFPIVGGVYRGDSWICQAAVHAGLFNDVFGGAGILELIGEEFNGYTGTTTTTTTTTTKRNGFTSYSFDSWFPKSYRFRSISNHPSTRFVRDFSWLVLAMQVLFTTLSLIYLRHWISKTWFFAYTFALIFWHVAFFSDSVHTHEFLSKAMGTFFIIIPFAYGFMQFGIKQTMMPIESHPYDIILFFVCPMFFGAYINHWSSPLPDLTLNAKLFQDTGQLITFIILISSVLVLGYMQFRQIYSYGRVAWYLTGYLIFFIIYLTLPFIVNLTIHLHHWLLALIIWPITVIPYCRKSMIYQGLMLGLFLNGAARWGLDPPLVPVGSSVYLGESTGSLLPVWNVTGGIINNNINNSNINNNNHHPVMVVHHDGEAGMWMDNNNNDNNDNQTISWIYPSDSAPDFQGYSVLLNDVEIYRGKSHNIPLHTILSRTRGKNAYLRVSITLNGKAVEYNNPLMVVANGTEIYFQSAP